MFALLAKCRTFITLPAGDIFASQRRESDMEFIEPVWGHISGAAFVSPCPCQWL